MENQEIRQYLINFAEKTLNKCEAFTKVYGKDFVRKRLEKNLEKVYTDISSSNPNTALYDMENSCITIFSENNLDKLLTVDDIENNKKLKHLILHESIHAIFRRTKEECQEFGIEDGTGILEFYSNEQELGRGFNEGLTEWICQKAGYGEQSYDSEKGIIKILELAIGEEAVMNLAKGDIKGNVAKILQMNEVECLQVMALVDNIYQNERKIHELGEMNSDNENIELDKSISNVESILFEKYFKNEIEIALNTKNLSEEIMQRLYDLSFCINGGKTAGSRAFTSKLPLRLKNELYPEILKKQQKTFIEQWKNSRQAENEQKRVDLPVKYKKSWFQKLKEAIKKKLKKETNQGIKYDVPPNQSNQQQFKEYISDMSNYSGEYIENSKENYCKSKTNLKNRDELDLS